MGNILFVPPPREPGKFAKVWKYGWKVVLGAVIVFGCWELYTRLIEKLLQ